VVSTTPRPLYPRERPGTHCKEGWLGPRAGLDVYEKSRPHRDYTKRVNPKNIRTGVAICTAVVVAQTMSSESVCQVVCSWVDVGSLHTRLFGVVYFAIASVREFLDTLSYMK
jgi:hypothetical protein